MAKHRLTILGIGEIITRFVHSRKWMRRTQGVGKVVGKVTNSASVMPTWIVQVGNDYIAVTFTDHNNVELKVVKTTRGFGATSLKRLAGKLGKRHYNINTSPLQAAA